MQLRVKELREAKGWNQTVLGYHAGLSPSQISLIENEKRNPTVETLEGIATALGVDIVELFPKVASRSSTEPGKGERLLAKLCRRLIEDLEADSHRWEAATRTGSIGRDGLREIIARRASIQRSLNVLDDVAETLGVDVSGRRGTALRRPQRDLQGAYNRWRAAWEGMVESHLDLLEGDHGAKARVLHGELEEPVTSRWLNDVA